MDERISLRLLRSIASIAAALIVLSLLADSASAQAPGVQWRRSDWFPVHPVTGPQTQATSGEDWWYDHKNSYNVTTNALQGYIAAGFSSFVNWTPSELSVGGCVDSHLHAPNCNELESTGTVTGALASTLALLPADGTAPLWFKMYHLGFFFRVIQTSDGGYLATGTSSSTRDFLGSPIYYNPGQTPLQTTDSFDLGDACLLTGGGKDHISLVKTDAYGNVEWQYLYGMEPYRDGNGNSDADDAFAATGLGWDVIETPTSFIMVGGATDLHHTYFCGSNNLVTRGFLIEVTKTGQWLSGQFLGPTTVSGNASAIARYSTGSGSGAKDHYVISSNELFPGGGLNGYTGCNLFQKVVLAQLDGTPAHLQEWKVTDFDIASPQNETSSQRTDDVRISNSTSSGNQILLPIIEKCTGCLYAAPNSGTGKVFRLDTSGQIVGFSDVGTVSAFDLKLRVTPTPDGGFAAVSTQQASTPPAPYACSSNTLYDTRYWNTDAYVGKFNAAGVLEWATTFGNAGPSDVLGNYPNDLKRQECLYSISQGQDGGFVVAGNNSSNFDDNYLAKLDPAPLHPGPDLSIQDTPLDAGFEPNPDSGPMWISDDIWVRNQDDHGIVHQNPLYSPTDPNYVYVRVTNRGDAPASGVLNVYWAKASTGLGWPAQWMKNVSAGILFGDRIPVTVPITLSPHDSVVVSVPWQVPNPEDFVSFGADKGHFCLLARVETATNPPYGMTFPEGSDIYQNTRNNTRIAWKNVTVVSGPMKKEFVVVRNISDLRAGIKLAFGASNASSRSLETFLSYGTIDVSLGRELFARWTLGGRVGKGVQVIPGRKIRLLNPNAWISGFRMAPGEMKTIAAQFNLTRQPSADMEFHFDVLQYSSIRGRESLVGGQRFSMPVQGLPCTYSPCSPE